MICSSNSWLRLRVPSSDEEEAAAAEAEELDSQRQRHHRFTGLKRIFVRVMVATMGCLFSCFRVRDSSPSSGNSAGVAVVKKQRSSLSSLLIVSEEDSDVVAKLNGDQSSGKPKPEHGLDFEDLKDEAKFLKTCGTLAETPDEIRKASQKFKDSSALEGQHERPEFKSWLTDSSTDKLNAETAKSNEPLTPSKDPVVKGLVSSEHTPNSCMTGVQNAERVHSRSVEGNDIMSAGSMYSSTGSSVTPADAPLIGTCKNKSVRFDCDSDMSSASSNCYSSGQYSKQSGSSSSSGPRFSPYPTPLKLSDEMQTPGTVFPAYMDGTGQGNTRIRCQYVHPMESFPELKEMQDDGSYSDNQNNRSGESFEQTDEESPTLEVDTDNKSSGEKYSKFEASLSPWLRKDPHLGDNQEELNGSAAVRKVRPVVTPADRPILGMVAAHWNDDEPTQNSPKWWGVNGIPNSTNKYKEDQKVSWHATPFEERLEKALSDETIISQRNQFSGTPPPDFSEAEESDTAVSQMQLPKHFKATVST